jgi:hypothetical protein
MWSSSQAPPWHVSQHALLPLYLRQQAPQPRPAFQVSHTSAAPVPSMPVVQAQYMQQAMSMHWPEEHAMRPWMPYGMEQMGVQRMRQAPPLHLVRHVMVHHTYAADVSG